MIRFSPRPWLNRTTSSRRRPCVKALSRHRCRLVLESLEGRWVPSTVTNLNDAGDGSLRQAILDTPAGGTVDFQPGLSGTITLTSGELAINQDLTIAGPGASVLTVSGNNASRVFDITATATLGISGLTIAHGHDVSITSIAEGGGINNLGALTLGLCTVSGNIASGPVLSGSGDGGGIYNAGALTITDSTISGNEAAGDVANGGGIDNAGTVTISNSTVSGNFTAPRPPHAGDGGGIFNTGTLTITNSTVSGNSGGVNGGGGVYTNSHAVSLGNTIVAGNRGSPDPDVGGSVDSQGYNLIGNPQGGSGYADTDLLNVDPMLGPLQDNGGPTPTMALLAGSPALDAGDPAQLGAADQRGVVRSGGVNVGAYQASATAFVVAAPHKVRAGAPFDVTVTAVDPFGQLAVGYTGTVTFSTSDPDPRVALPADYAFTLADGGSHTFMGQTTLWTRGHQTLSATDTSDGSIVGSVTIKVRHAGHGSSQGDAAASGSAQAPVPQPSPDAAGNQSAYAGARSSVALGMSGQVDDAFSQGLGDPLVDQLALSLLSPNG